MKGKRNAGRIWLGVLAAWMLLNTASTPARAADSRAAEQIECWVEEGRIISETHTAFRYDDDGRLCGKRMYSPATEYSEEYTRREFTYEYYPDGALKSFVNAGGKGIRPGVFISHYDPYGHVMEVQPFQYVQEIYDMFTDWGICIGTDTDREPDLREFYDSEGKIVGLTAEYQGWLYYFLATDYLENDNIPVMCQITCEYSYDESGRVKQVTDVAKCRDNSYEERKTITTDRIFTYFPDGSYECSVSTEHEGEQEAHREESVVRFNPDGTPGSCTYSSDYSGLWMVDLEYDENGDVVRYESPAHSIVGSRYEFEFERGPYGFETYRVYGVDENGYRGRQLYQEDRSYDQNGRLSGKTVIWHSYNGATENYQYEYVDEPCGENQQFVMENGEILARKTPFIHSPYEPVS